MWRSPDGGGPVTGKRDDPRPEYHPMLPKGVGTGLIVSAVLLVAGVVWLLRTVFG